MKQAVEEKRRTRKLNVAAKAYAGRDKEIRRDLTCSGIEDSLRARPTQISLYLVKGHGLSQAPF